MLNAHYFQISVDLWGAFFCLIAMISILIGNSYDKKGSRMLIELMICSMLMMVSNLLVRIFTGQEGETAYQIVRFSTYTTYFFGLLTMPLVTGYLTHLIVTRSEIDGLLWEYVEWVIFLIGAALLTVNFFTGFIYTIDTEATYQARTFTGMLPGILGIFGLLISFGVVLEYLKYFNKFEKVAFIAYLLLPLAAIGADLVLYRLTFSVVALVVSSLLLYFSFEVNSRVYRRELEKSLADQQIRMFHSQISPHFIFNSLSVIKYQSRKSPEEAADTIDEFADYLRSCSDMMSSVDCVPVDRELELVQHYFNLQKKRFGDSIEFRTDIQDTDFEIPPFTIQTLVENAYTHGVRASANGNEYISVKTYKSHNAHIIEIEDNGAGFDTRILEDQRDTQHVGIRNTSDRLRLMCNGSMRIESAPGKGTKVTITVPESRKTL